VLVAVSILLTSCGDDGSTSPESGGSTTQTEQPRVGQSVRMPAGETTLVVTVQKVIFPLRGSGALLAPGDRAAGVEVAVRNAGKGIYDSSSESDVGLRLSTTQFAEASYAARGPCATSEVDFLKEVAAGESRSGCVAFDVPKNAKPRAVRFAPEGRDAQSRTWIVE
jgi:Domain of unknown function (DUF4352)